MKKAPVETTEARFHLLRYTPSSFAQTRVPAYRCGAAAPHDSENCVRCAFIRGYTTRAILAYRSEVA